MPRTTASCCLALTLAAFSPAALNSQMQMPACHAMPAQTNITSPEKLPPPQKLTGIGNLHFPISSHNPETQAWFDQGINLIFDFWDYEANRAFEQAIRTDPNCAICHWGLAQSLGIHNQEVQGYAHDELQKAVALRSHADKREQMYIDASVAEEADKPSKKKGEDDEATVLLRSIVHKYPHDLTARLMLSEAVQDGYEDGKARKGTAEMIELLQAILKEKPDDSAANHLWIHAVEASPHPEQALYSAQTLADLAPNSGHMTHMPGHIFYRTGDYQRAQVSFDLSTSVDEAYMQAQHVVPDDDWNYVHNLMYSIANLMEQGRMKQAALLSDKLPHARGVRAASIYPWSTRDSITRLNPTLPIALRSGDWALVQALLADAKPPASLPNLQSLAASLDAFAHGMQSISAKDLGSARRQSADLDARLWRLSQLLDEQEAASKKKPEDPAKSTKPTNQVQPTDQTLESMVKNLAILSLELRSAILIQENKVPDAEALLTQARREEQDLGYHEPPAFIRPVAEQQAEFLMQADADGKLDGKIEKAWRQALEDRPKSGFPLYGLALLAEKSGDTVRTQAAYREFLDAWKSADPALPQIEHAHHWLDALSQQNASHSPSASTQFAAARISTGYERQ